MDGSSQVTINFGTHSTQQSSSTSTRRKERSKNLTLLKIFLAVILALSAITYPVTSIMVLVEWSNTTQTNDTCISPIWTNKNYVLISVLKILSLIPTMTSILCLICLIPLIKMRKAFFKWLLLSILTTLHIIPIISAFIVSILLWVWTGWAVVLPDGTQLMCESTIATYLESSIVFIPNFASIAFFISLVLFIVVQIESYIPAGRYRPARIGQFKVVIK